MKTKLLKQLTSDNGACSPLTTVEQLEEEELCNNLNRLMRINSNSSTTSIEEDDSNSSNNNSNSDASKINVNTQQSQQQQQNCSDCSESSSSSNSSSSNSPLLLLDDDLLQVLHDNDDDDGVYLSNNGAGGENDTINNTIDSINTTINTNDDTNSCLLTLMFSICGKSKKSMNEPKVIIRDYTVDNINFGDDVGFQYNNYDCYFFGLADGVSGNSKKGFDAKQFPLALMSICSYLLENDYENLKLASCPPLASSLSSQVTSSTAPSCDEFDDDYDGEASSSLMLMNKDNLLFDLLCKSHQIVQDKCVYGSSTVCLLSINKKTNTLNTLNLGDSGYMLIRDNQVFYKSVAQSHRYNAPYQIGCTPPELCDIDLYRDMPEDSICLTHHVQSGDFLLLSSDGLFDNLYEDEIALIINNHVKNSTITQQLLDSVCQVLVNKACKDGKFYQKQAGLNPDIRFKEEWIDVCSVYVRAAPGLSRNTQTKDCSITKHDGILELRVFENNQFNCKWKFETSDGNIDSLRYSIEDKYRNSMSLAIRDNNCEAALSIINDRKNHLSRIKSVKHKAWLSATAESKPFWGSSGKCDLILQAKVTRLEV